MAALASPARVSAWELLLFALTGARTAEAPEHPPDPRHLGALRRGDHDAWRGLFEEESAALYRYALSRLGSREDAEDVTNQVFAEAWRNIGRFQDRGLPVRAWLFGIARRLASKHRARFMSRNPPLSLEALELDPPSGSGADEQLALVQALRGLDSKQGEVLTLRFVHGLSLAEVAAVLGTSVDGIKGRQKRGLEALRRALGEGGSGA